MGLLMMGDEDVIFFIFSCLLSPSSTFVILMLGQYHMQSEGGSGAAKSRRSDANSGA